MSGFVVHMLISAFSYLGSVVTVNSIVLRIFYTTLPHHLSLALILCSCWQDGGGCPSGEWDVCADAGAPHPGDHHGLLHHRLHQRHALPVRGQGLHRIHRLQWHREWKRGRRVGGEGKEEEEESVVVGKSGWEGGCRR